MIRPLLAVATATMAIALCLASPVRAADEIGGPFKLTDQDGRSVTDRTYHGKPVLLYFGFTSCPDVCPTDLARIERIAQRVRRAGVPAPTPIFISIDPERDTPAKMKAYVAAFGKDFVGLTGTPAQIARIADHYDVYYRKVPYGHHGQYMMDHSTFLFLLDARGRYVDHFGRNADERQVAQRIMQALRAARPPVAGR